jgi:enolase
MDVAASEFHKEGKYDLDFKNPNSNPADWVSFFRFGMSFFIGGDFKVGFFQVSSEKLGEMYKGFIADAPVISIEDPFDQVTSIIQHSNNVEEAQD